MKGVILAGGMGTRLYPLTYAVNKHLLPIGRLPMICRAVTTLVGAGIEQMVIVTNAECVEQFEQQISRMPYAEYDAVVSILGQREPDGIASAIGRAEVFAGGEPVVVLLADNIYERSLRNWVDSYVGDGACALLACPDPRMLSSVGVAVFNDRSRIVRIEEKPFDPLSGFAVTGAYIFDEAVWNMIPRLSRSERGELEVTSILDVYARAEALEYEVTSGFWIDAGQSVEAYYEATDFARSQEEGRPWVGSSTSADSRETTSSLTTPSKFERRE